MRGKKCAGHDGRTGRQFLIEVFDNAIYLGIYRSYDGEKWSSTAGLQISKFMGVVFASTCMIRKSWVSRGHYHHREPHVE